MNSRTMDIPILTDNIQTETKTKSIAYIITENCNSLRFNATKKSIEQVFPKFFDIRCFLTIPLNDSRIHSDPTLLMKKFSSNLLAFIELWTYKIPNHSKTNEVEWTFIFEDDVNFNDPVKFGLTNYIKPLRELMYNDEIRSEHGFLYLGICGPTFDNNSRPIVSKNTKNTLLSRKGFGYCLHATGITTNRSRLFWTEISSYRPDLNDVSLDFSVRKYCRKSGNHFYTLGSNLHFPPNTGHYGIAYQDRGRFSTTVTK